MRRGGQCRRRCRRCRFTPLHNAAGNGNAAATAALLGAGADATIKNHKGYAAPRRAAGPTATAAAPLPAGTRQSDGRNLVGRAPSTRRRWSRCAAAPLAISPPRRHWLRCARTRPARAQRHLQHVSHGCTADAPSRPLSRTSRVCCRPSLSWRRRRRCVPSRCASVCAEVHAGVPGRGATYPPRMPFGRLFPTNNDSTRSFPAVA